MDLKYNTPIQVNKRQYEWVKKYLKGLFAHRMDENGNYWIKPFLFQGQKTEIERVLSKLR